MLLIILLFLIVGGVLTLGLLGSLMGEIQGALSYRQAVQALSVAEAGLHYAVVRVNEAGGAAFAGESNRTVSHPIKGTIGVFDVTVRCSDGTAPGSPNPCAAADKPNIRLLTSTGYVPSKAIPLGRRTVVMTIRQEAPTAFDFGVCGVDGVTLDRDTQTYGSVGSNHNISLLGPPKTAGALARVYASIDGTQQGDAVAGGAVSCSGACGSPYRQVAGTVTSYNTPGRQVCPVLPPVTCNPSTSSSGDRLSQSTLTISATNGNTVLRHVEMGSNSTLTFATTGPNDLLEVHLNTLRIGQSSSVRITGGGKVVLHLAGRMEISQGTHFGVDGAGAAIAPGRFVLRSCATDNGDDYAIEFHQTGQINASLFAPNGRVQLDQASLSQGVIQARTVQFDRGTVFRYDTTSLSVGGGPYNTVIAWREQP